MRPAGCLIQRCRSHDAPLGFAAVRALLTPDKAGGGMNVQVQDVPKAAGLLSLDIIVVEAGGVHANAGRCRPLAVTLRSRGNG